MKTNNKMLTNHSLSKGLLFLLLFLSITACSKKKETAAAPATTTEQNTQATAVNKDSTAEDSSAQVDGMSSATSKPNEVTFNGTIVTPPQRKATVTMTMGGVIRSTSILPGQAVRRGAVLAALENPDFINLQQTYLDCHAQVEYLHAEYQRQKALSSQEAASQKKYQQSKADYLSMLSKMQSAATQLSLLHVSPASLLKGGIHPRLFVHAPIGGFIGNINMNIGKYVQPGEMMCEIIDKSAPLLCLTTYEKDLEKVKKGKRVEFRVNGMGNKIFYATIISIGQVVDKVSRSLEVYARINTSNAQFRPGMYITARINK